MRNESVASLLCELTRICSLKEDSFAARFGLSPSEFRFVKLFSDNSSHTIRELRENLQITPGRITHLLDSLEKKKIIRRTVASEDNRSITVSLTEHALPFIEELHKEYDGLHDQILNLVKHTDREVIFNSLQFLIKRLQDTVENHRDRIVNGSVRFSRERDSI